MGSNPKEWWIDTGATRHVCSDKMMFSTFEPIETGEKVFMGNSATSDIKGQIKTRVFECLKKNGRSHKIVVDTKHLILNSKTLIITL